MVGSGIEMKTTKYPIRPPSNHPRKHEEEHLGSIWKHPYMIYSVLTVILFLFLIAAGYLALKNGWIPNQAPL